MGQDNLEILRHSTSHLMAAAVLTLFPKAKLGIGPAISDGFYYDFDLPVGKAGLPEKISNDDLAKIEKIMQDLAKKKLPFERKELTIGQAKKWARKENQPYKLELIEELERQGEKIVSFYKTGNLFDLCTGPHIPNSSQIKHFKLLSIAGAYWRGIETNPMLTRIYGTVWPTKKELQKHVLQLEERKLRDHRKLGKDLDLFTFAEEVGPGLPLWTSKGTVIREELEKWAMETEKNLGYERVATPHVGKHTLYEISGHLPYYKDDMYPPMNIEGEDYYLKGMNCPHHHMIYLAKPRSYRELPLRLAEYGTVYRLEQSGALFGLMRARSIAQNDAHIYCTEEQAEEEFLNVLKLHEYYYNTLGLGKGDYHIVIGLPNGKKRGKYHGDKKLWDKAEKMMRSAIKKSGIRHIDDLGGAAFYGPKIDFNVISSVGREFGIATNQLDLYMPKRFNLAYTDSKGAKKLAVVIHRAPLGSHERFIGFLIEHFGGAFPVWLSPVQAIIIPIAQRHTKYAEGLKEKLVNSGIRTECDLRSETMQAKIRDSQLQKIPYMLVVGDREEKSKTLAIRTREGKEIKGWTIDHFISKIKENIVKKGLNLII
jgi:threonyl-tRNA synthetase